MRLRLVLVSAVGVALSATAALVGTAQRTASVGYTIVFQGSGRATATYPPVPGGTTFTSTISWKLVYRITVSPDGGSDGLTATHPS